VLGIIPLRFREAVICILGKVRVLDIIPLRFREAVICIFGKVIESWISYTSGLGDCPVFYVDKVRVIGTIPLRFRFLNTLGKVRMLGYITQVPLYIR